MYSGGQYVLENQLKFSAKLEIKVAHFFVQLTSDQRQKQYIFTAQFNNGVGWSATRDFVQKYDARWHYDVCRFRSNIVMKRHKGALEMRRRVPLQYVRGTRRRSVTRTNQRSALIEFSAGVKRATPEIQKISWKAKVLLRVRHSSDHWTPSFTHFNIYFWYLKLPSRWGEWRQWLTLSEGRLEMLRWNACWSLWQLVGAALIEHTPQPRLTLMDSDWGVLSSCKMSCI